MVAIALVNQDETGLRVSDGRERSDPRSGLWSVFCLCSGKSLKLQVTTYEDNELDESRQRSFLYYSSFKINYLDEHDVNAFEVIADGNPFLLCTTMTHTPGSTTTKVTV